MIVVSPPRDRTRRHQGLHRRQDVTMTIASQPAAAKKVRTRPIDRPISDPGQIVLVLQGGGALGAYQAGVYEALHEAGIEPDWIIGTSIGAINASLIAGNDVADRVPRLKEFWGRVADPAPWHAWSHAAPPLSYWKALSSGIRGFFEPNPLALLGPHTPLGADRAGYYSTAPLERTLLELVDFSLINRCKPRLTLGAAQLRTSQMRYFDGRDGEIGVKHVMASGALPPAFPAVRIDGELYWDGGILSNTPIEVVFDDVPRRNSLIFAVHMWNPIGAEPETIWDVLHRQKDIQYSSRVANHTARQTQIHRLRHVITQLLEHIPKADRDSEAVRALAGYGCLTRMHVVRLLAPRLEHEDFTKDVDFTPDGIRRRWEAGHESARRAVEQAPWRAPFGPLDGVILHEPTDAARLYDVLGDAAAAVRRDGAALPIEATAAKA
jgi:NTE family protein